MNILSPRYLSEESPCPYLKDRNCRQEHFWGGEASPEEFQALLDKRYRRFGLIFFRPICPDCRRCVPIRVDTRRFTPGSGQKRVLRRNRDTVVRFSELVCRPGMYEIFEKHSREKFGQESDREEFHRNFFQSAVPSFQSEFYVEDRLAGFGILDRTATGLSSAYFCYDPDYSSLSLGTFSILAEIGETRRRELPFYYTGYYIAECPKMAYKGKFHPRELLTQGLWRCDEEA